MKKLINTILLGLGLVGLSAALHAVHYAIFQDLHHILIYLLADIAFIPLEVFFVSVVLERIIEKRDARTITKKINMLVGLFYQEVGNDILTKFVNVDKGLTSNNLDATIDFKWDATKYKKLQSCIKMHKYSVAMEQLDLKGLDLLLTEKKDMVVNLITNPTIHEHGAFSEVLMSLFHLADELKHRPLDALAKEDIDHLKVDIDRVYRKLAEEWVTYMSHLQVDYPYLFLAAVKSNPFDKRQATVKEQVALQSYVE